MADRRGVSMAAVQEPPDTGLFGWKWWSTADDAEAPGRVEHLGPVTSPETDRHVFISFRKVIPKVEEAEDVTFDVERTRDVGASESKFARRPQQMLQGSWTVDDCRHRGIVGSDRRAVPGAQ